MVKSKGTKKVAGETIPFQSEKLLALQKAMDKINSTFGVNTARFMDSEIQNIAVIPTGSLSIDRVLSVGGLPLGRVVEMYGPESSGKTTIALLAIASAQRMGMICAFIDVEHAFSPTYASSLGVNVETLVFSQPDSAEQAFEVAETLVDSGAISLLVLDSIASLITQPELDGDMGDNHVGLLARFLSSSIKKMVPTLSKNNATLICINQLREKIGVMYGNPETTPGGRALKFYSSVRLDIRKKEAIKEGDKVIGNRVRVKAVKNKVGAPFKECEITLRFDVGYSPIEEIIDLAVEHKIINKGGSWYSYNDIKLGQGVINVAKYLGDNSALLIEIKGLVVAALDKAEEEARKKSRENFERQIKAATNVSTLNAIDTKNPSVDSNVADNISNSDDFDTFDIPENI